MATLSGICRNADGSPTQKLVRVYRRESGAFIALAVSSASTGAWSVTVPSATDEYFAVQDAGTPNPNAENIALALHFRGANGSTSIVDECGNAISLYGNAQISTAQSFFGGSSLLLDGTGDGFYVPDTAKLRPGTGDFSLRFAQRYVSKSGYQTIFSKGYGVAGALILQTGNGDGKINVYQGATAALVAAESGSTVNAGTWYDIEVERTDGVLTIRRDGTTYASASDPTNYNATANMIFGGGSATGFNNYYFNGYFDEIEFYTGVSPTSHATRTAEFVTHVSGGADYDLVHGRLTPV